MTANEPITPLDIQYLLKKRKITQKSLAKKYGKSEMAISDVINFRLVSRPLMRAIAKEIDMPADVVFAWYFNGESSRPRLYEPDSNAA